MRCCVEVLVYSTVVSNLVLKQNKLVRCCVAVFNDGTQHSS